MIGLAGLADGAFIRMHPAGALYVLIHQRAIIRAELAILGQRDLITWKAGRPPRRRLADNVHAALTAGEVVLAV